MSNRQISAVLLLLSLAAISIGYLLRNPALVGLCPSGLGYNCLSEFWRYGVASPLFWSTYLLPPFFFALIFVRKEVFWAWAKFISVFAVIGLLIILGTPPLGGLFSSDRTSMTEGVIQFLVALSIIFIVWKYWTLSKKKK